MEHKRGDTFDYVATIPDTFADGYFVGWDVTAQIRKSPSGPLAKLAGTEAGELIASLDVSWADPLTTRTLHVLKIDTTGWPMGAAEFDVQFKRQSDGYRLSTATLPVTICRDATT